MIKLEANFAYVTKDSIKSYTQRINEEFLSNKIGYYHLPNLGNSLDKEFKKLGNDLSWVKNIVLIGIGGSSLGVKAVSQMLSTNKKNLLFMDNLDPQSILNTINKIKLNDSLFIVSSKSGETIETITIFKFILNHFNITNIKDFNKNFIIITDPDTALQNLAIENEIKFFNIPKNVGGRFSVLSAIGLVPLYLCGYDTKALLEGALQCQKRYIHDEDESLIAKAYHYATHRHAKINVIFSYSDKLSYFNDWYVQLWAESLGKKRDYKRIGLTPVGLIGSKDQHSFLQLIMDGIKDKTITFIKIKDHGANLKIPNISLKGLQGCDFVSNINISDLLNLQCDATAMALKQEGLSVDIITLDKLDEWHAGWLIYYYELLTSATGIMLGINTYDQPGVEISKRILKLLLTKN